jgi:hypothetical protein
MCLGCFICLLGCTNDSLYEHSDMNMHEYYHIFKHQLIQHLPADVPCDKLYADLYELHCVFITAGVSFVMYELV